MDSLRLTPILCILPLALLDFSNFLFELCFKKCLLIQFEFSRNPIQFFDQKLPMKYIHENSAISRM